MFTCWYYWLLPVYFFRHPQVASPAGQTQVGCDSSHSAGGAGRHCQVSLMWLSCSFRPCQGQEAGRGSSQCQRPATRPLPSPPKSCRQCQHQLATGESAPCCQLYCTFHLLCFAQGRFIIGVSAATWPKSTWDRTCWSTSTCCWPRWWWWWWWGWWWPCLCLSASPWCSWWPCSWWPWSWRGSSSTGLFTSSVAFLHSSSCAELSRLHSPQMRSQYVCFIASSTCGWLRMV